MSYYIVGNHKCPVANAKSPLAPFANIATIQRPLQTAPVSSIQSYSQSQEVRYVVRNHTSPGANVENPLLPSTNTATTPRPLQTAPVSGKQTLEEMKKKTLDVACARFNDRMQQYLENLYFAGLEVRCTGYTRRFITEEYSQAEFAQIYADYNREVALI